MFTTTKPGRGIVKPLFTHARIKAEKLIKAAKKEGKTLTLAEALAIVNPKPTPTPKPTPVIRQIDPTADERYRLHLVNKGILLPKGA